MAHRTRFGNGFVMVLISGLMAATIGCSAVVDVPPGFEGAEYEVPMYRSEGGGLKTDEVLTPGRHVLGKLNSVCITVDTRPVIRPLDIQIRMADELNVSFHIELTTEVLDGHGPELMALYATMPLDNKADLIESDDYYRVIQPVYESVTRTRISGEASLQVAQRRQKIAADILTELRVQLAEEPLLEHITLTRVTIGNIDYPASVDKAIESRAKADQELAEKDRRLEIAVKDAEIQRVEAKGVADAQAIIDKTLTREYLYHEWIEALESTAKTKNTTIIYVPVGNDGLPLMRGVQ